MLIQKYTNEPHHLRGYWNKVHQISRQYWGIISTANAPSRFWWYVNSLLNGNATNEGGINQCSDHQCYKGTHPYCNIPIHLECQCNKWRLLGNFAWKLVTTATFLGRSQNEYQIYYLHKRACQMWTFGNDWPSWLGDNWKNVNFAYHLNS